MTTSDQASNMHLDDAVDDEIAQYVALEAPRSFFLLAGAGSGKTRSLVKALNHVRARYGKRLALRGQQIGVITYTNAACKEIQRRIEFDQSFYVATVHSFSWELIKGFGDDIRRWLKEKIESDIAKLYEAEERGRAGTKTSIERLAKIESKQRRRARLDTTSKFVYSPTGDNREENALNHTEVVEICAHFIATKSIMKWVLIGRFPILLIDESQDTDKELLDALAATAQEHAGQFGLGLFGDEMQRIYGEGKERLEQGLPDTWPRPSKKLNHRSPKRVVTLINQIRSETDSHRQESRTDASDGVVRMFIRSARSEDRQEVEASIRNRMAEITADMNWRSLERCKVLTLEHHMAARRLGFSGITEPLLAVERFRTGLLDGTLPATRFLTETVLPLIEAAQRADKFAVAKIVRARSPLLAADLLQTSDPVHLLARANDAVAALMDVGQEPTCGAVLDIVAASGLFTIPDMLKPAVALRSPQGASEEPHEDTADPLAKETEALLLYLQAPFREVSAYKAYVSGLAPFDTHQGVKGLEFDRVMVLMDDTEARGFMFRYEKLFGAEDLSDTDKKNLEQGREIGVDRTRRLFYVTCSRAEKSLAVVIYTENADAVIERVLRSGWFGKDEIDYEA
jgi:DNA helicase-2/ATP-dependent DNA helicase PcrA